MLDTGEEAPTFELPNQNGEPVALSDYEGQRVILYFYPRAHTAGCTRQAQSFRDEWEAFVDRDVAVLGVSNDPVEDLASFEKEHDLPFQLLSDEDGTVARQYDSDGEVEHEGDVYEIALRNTFVIDPEGRIEAVYEDVDPDGHAEMLLEDLD